MKRKGFSLVELLIVIAIIGVLSATMMLSSTEAVSSAKATRVITAMTNLKKAVIAWYVDNHDMITIDNEGYKIKTSKGIERLSDYIQTNKKAILKYLNNSDSINFQSKREAEKPDAEAYRDIYVFLDVKYKNWYIYYKVDSDSRLKSKIAAKAKSLGLFGLNGNIKNEGNLLNNIKNKKYYSNETYVCMLALTLAEIK